MNSLVELARQCPDISLTVKAGDLLEAMRCLVMEVMPQAPGREDRLLSRAEVAEMCGVDVSTLWRWDRDGYLKPVKIGRAVRYHTSDVMAILKKRK